mgnify:FL=1|tara:strand:+ start:479 stop:688 length:210 start_codon:yes stop_codon:yes gene_type:complete
MIISVIIAGGFVMFKFFKKAEYVVKFKQDRYQNWVLESLRIPASSEEELVVSMKRITEIIQERLKEMNQ